MKWESLNLHIENLFPGLISFVLIIALFPSLFVFENHEFLSKLLSNNFVLIGLFLSTSYIIGILVVVLSRLIIDRISELLPRPLLLKILARGTLKDKTFKEINDEYRRLIKKALNSDKDSIKTEVLKRRERGRLVRTTFFPTIMAIIYITSNQTCLIQCLYIFLTFIVFLIFYSYVESTIFEECQLVEQ